MRQNRLINFSQPGVKKGNFMNEEKELKKKSNVGMGIVYGLIFGVIIGLIFFPDNFAIGPGIGMSLGIVIGAIMDANQNKKSPDIEK